MRENAKTRYAAIGAALFAALLLSLAAPFVPAFAADDDPCGYAYLDPIEGDPGMYALVLQKEPREEGVGFIDMGVVRQRGGWANTTSPNSFNRSTIREVRTEGKIKPLDMTGWFRDLQNLEKADLNGIDTSGITALDKLFSDCYALREVDVSTWDTSRVQSMWWTFYNCTSLESIDFFTRLNAESLVSLNNTFAGCESLEDADLSSMNMPKVKSLICVFEDCISMKRAALPREGLSSVENIPHLFAGCTLLEAVDFGSLDASQATAHGTSYGGLDPLFGCCTLRTIALAPHFGKPEALADAFDGGVAWKPDGADDACATPADMVAFAAARSGESSPIVFSAQLGDDSIIALEKAQGATLAIRTGWRDLQEGESYLGVVKTGGLPWESRRQQYRSVVFESPVAPTSMARWFSGFANLVDIANMEKLDTSQVTDMSYLFGREAQWTHREAFISGYVGCHSLVKLDLSHFDTSQVTDMSYLFSGATALRTLDLTKFDCGNVTNMSNMFNMTTMGSYAQKPSDVGNYYGEHRSSLTEIELPASLKTSKVTDMTSMFQNCSSLISLNVSSLDTSNVVYANAMFFGCESLISLDVSSMSTANMTFMNDMFSCCKKLQKLDISEFDVSKAVDMGYLVWGCSSLTEFAFNCKNTGNVIWASHMFAHCDKLESLAFGDVDLSSVQDVRYSFKRDASECPSLKTVTVAAGAKLAPSIFPTGMWQDEGGAVYRANRVPSGVGEAHEYTRVEDWPRSYAVLTSSGELKLSSVELEVGEGDQAFPVSDEGYRSAEDVPWHERRLDVKSVVISDLDDVESTSFWFSGCENLERFTLENLSAIQLSSMSEMFAGCSSLCEVDLSGITSTVYGGVSYLWLDGLFDGCTQLRSVKLPDKCAVFGAAAMFRNCTSLDAIDWGDGISGVTGDCSEMFRNCASLEFLDLSWLDTKNATSLKRMLHGCTSLQSIELGAGFTFRGMSTSRLPGSEFPAGAWRQDGAEDAKRAYASDSIPNLKAATYVKVAEDKLADYTIESVRGDAEGSAGKYIIETELVPDGDGYIAELTLDLDNGSDDPADAYASDELVIGEASKASSALPTVTAKTVTAQTLKGVKANSSKVHTVIVGPQVGSIAAYAFKDCPGVSTVQVRSAKLTTQKSVAKCLAKSNVRYVNLPARYLAKSAKTKVKNAFVKWSKPKCKCKIY